MKIINSSIVASVVGSADAVTIKFKVGTATFENGYDNFSKSDPKFKLTAG